MGTPARGALQRGKRAPTLSMPRERGRCVRQLKERGGERLEVGSNKCRAGRPAKVLCCRRDCTTACDNGGTAKQHKGCDHHDGSGLPKTMAAQTVANGRCHLAGAIESAANSVRRPLGRADRQLLPPAALKLSAAAVSGE